MNKSVTESIIESKGNVFADLEIPHPREMLAKAQLVQRICDTIAERKLTQTRAAALEVLRFDSAGGSFHAVRTASRGGHGRCLGGHLRVRVCRTKRVRR